MTKTNKFFKDVGFYLGSNFFSNVLNFITGVVVRRVLQPVSMGLFNQIMLVFDYARYSHIGIIDALDKELPILYGEKDYEKLARVRDIGFSLCMMIVLFISSAIFLSSFIIYLNSDPLFVLGIRIVSLMVILRLAGSLYIVLNRSRNRFSIISKYTILIAVFDLVFKVFLVTKFGLSGLLWSSVLTMILGLGYFYIASGEKFRFLLDFSFREVMSLFKVGFPIFIFGLVFMTLLSIDRIMIIMFLDRESLGLYTIALMVSTYAAQLPNLIYAVIFPRFYQAYGEKQDIFKIRELFVKPTIIFAYLFPILIGVIIIILPLLVYYVLPAYERGLVPAYILILGYSFVALLNMPQYLLIALNKQLKMVPISAFCVVLAIIFIYLFSKKMNLGLSGVAIGASLAHFLHATILMVYALRNYTKRFFDHIRFFAELYVPFLWVVFLLLALRLFIFRPSGDVVVDILHSSLKCVIFIGCCIPLILYANKRTGIFVMLKKAYFKKTKYE